jgi:hypothetical protein
MNKPSLACARYVLTFIYYFSLFNWVYFLTNKDMVFVNFKQFKVLTEKQCAKPIKCLRFDNGGEYLSNAFEGYLS